MTMELINNENPLYILMISPHGLIRGNNMELGRDADTGGQTTYVVELVRALARHCDVGQVDLLTRLIDDPAVSTDYSQPIEEVSNGARILRLPFGPSHYIRKELLWPHLDQLVDRSLHFLRQQGRLPDLIHTHYADAGYVGQQLSLLLGIPQVHTGHSLGRPKQSRLLASGRKKHAIERQFNFERRIAVEEDLLVSVNMVVTSTRQEVTEQYGMYHNHDRSRFVVIPPGTDITRFSPPGRRKINPNVMQMVDKFLSNPAKPIILTICRPSIHKNLKGLIEAYGGNTELQERANLVIVSGNRDDIRELDEASQKVLRELLLDIDRYDLWGCVAIPKHHAAEDVPELYRLAARRRGVFVNPALTEPFGLTLIETAASGLPFVATEDGGPRDILANCCNGLLVNPLDPVAIAAALSNVLSDKQQWRMWSKNGVIGARRHYSWDAHVSKYMKEVRRLLHRDRKRMRRQISFTMQDGKSPMPLARKALVSDIDNTLLGNKKGLKQLISWLEKHAGSVVFGVATGRSLESAVKILKNSRVPIPNVLITSVGSEINYGPRLQPDVGWANRIAHLWRRDALEQVLSGLPGLILQTAENQRKFKLSYNVISKKMPSLQDLYRLLREHRLHARLIYSHEEFLDVLPIRASKGHAIRYLAYKWGLPLENFLVVGDSGNDKEMLLGDTLGIVVGNYSPELEPLRDLEQIYFAQGHQADGILEGLVHYNWRIEHNK
ncbi:MAG: HAD-IIB family hydrolase [Nitrosomonas sp.]|uniref:HAD-IIB family hydrolase n=1 Tax=Nitrosomonas sp. TaxID=42353 RepID=UPI0027316BB6|nr:HAD-IIB family hydrolase [Nitrosomonas sp.]MDP1549596.1 HAD-IIB family hydrolase [Nitrosomonas sp.]MDP1786078.1 HAD-IIB family hydrolase [Nitrosomonas sp.]MDP1934090.1 HAD-IIB family hydrolase [Nitrosomonas sp.]MDP2223220.1 HAD-IIB family hydrolase [Nitrosomonas sp.]MDP3281949.1 HAD-IIB family hydrolase [Nitrosomonas sp.]